MECGAYGCGAFPAVPCGNINDGDNDVEVSKLFKKPESFTHELEQYKLFEALDPDGLCTVRLTKWCDVPIAQLLPDRVLAKGPFADFQIKYEFGGKTLVAMFLEGDPVDFGAVEDILMVQFPKIIRFLMVMRDNALAHNDLHPFNIVYSPSKGLRFIDFGMAVSGPDADVSRSSKDKTWFGDCILGVLDEVDNSAAPSGEWVVRLDNARAFLRYMYDSMELEEVLAMWEVAMHDTEHTFIHRFVKPALLHLAESKQTFRDDPDAFAKASELATDSTITLNEFQTFLKQCFLDMVWRVNPGIAQKMALYYKPDGKTLMSFVLNPMETFPTFAGRFGKL